MFSNILVKFQEALISFIDYCTGRNKNDNNGPALLEDEDYNYTVF